MRQRVQALLHLRADSLELVLVRGLGGGEFLLNTLPCLELGRGDTRVGVGTGLLGGTRGGIALGSGSGDLLAGVHRSLLDGRIGGRTGGIDRGIGCLLSSGNLFLGRGNGVGELLLRHSSGGVGRLGRGTGIALGRQLHFLNLQLGGVQLGMQLGELLGRRLAHLGELSCGGVLGGLQLGGIGFRLGSQGRSSVALDLRNLLGGRLLGSCDLGIGIGVGTDAEDWVERAAEFWQSVSE